MKSAIIALSPTLGDEPEKLIPLLRQIRSLQGKGLFRWTGVASVVHPNLYPYPLSFYQTLKLALRVEAKEGLRAIIEGRLSYHAFQVLTVPGSGPGEVVDLLSKHTLRKRASVLVLSDLERSGFYRQIAGSTSEDAAFSATVPVLVLKPRYEIPLDQETLGIVFAVDPLRPPSQRAIDHVKRAAQTLGAVVRVVYVRDPRKRYFAVPHLQSELDRVVNSLRTGGVGAISDMIEAKDCKAMTLENYAAQWQVCMITVSSPKRSLWRSLFRRSLTRKLLREAKRPVFVLRVE